VSFHAFCDQCVYLPLLVFDQDGDLRTAGLCPGKDPGARGTVAVLELMRIRARWLGLEVSSVPTAQHKLGFILGMQPNVRLKELAEQLQEKTRRTYLRTGRKVFTSDTALDNDGREATG